MAGIAAVCVFCGSSKGQGERETAAAFRSAARTTGRTLAERGQTLVYGGASIGLMGLVADAALEAGGRVIGAIPHRLVDLEVAHKGLSKQLVVETMHERKAAMAAEADAFVVLPGGIGTMDELFEAWTWSQIGLHRKPIGILNVGGFFDRLLAFVDTMVAEGFLLPEHRAMLVVEEEIGPLLDRLEDTEIIPIEEWIERWRK